MDPNNRTVAWRRIALVRQTNLGSAHICLTDYIFGNISVEKLQFYDVFPASFAFKWIPNLFLSTYVDERVTAVFTSLHLNANEEQLIQSAYYQNTNYDNVFLLFYCSLSFF